jgi:1-acyl-sn-glycerol-3-phosphate acyltransferase
MMDILLEGRAFREHLDRQAYYIMKSTLPFQNFLGYLGGIPITRVKDVRKASKEERLAMLKEARQQEEDIYTRIIPDIITGRYKRIVPRIVHNLDRSTEKIMSEERELLVVHPEGTRNPSPKPNLQRAILENLLRSQKIAGQQIVFIPVNIKYQEKPKKVVMSFGPQKVVPDDGVEELANHWLDCMK